jgi:hypothetical protein
MYHMMDVHPLTLMIIMSSIMLTPFFALVTYAFSGGSIQKGALIGIGFLLQGGFMTWVCLANIPASLGPFGALIIPVFWIIPSIILFSCRTWFLDKPLSQHLLISLQLCRAIGAVFLFEMMRGNIPGIFALPAGIGDIAVALIAAAVLLRYRGLKTIPAHAIILVIISGVVDFLSAFFFGFSSSVGPFQIFFPEIINNVNQFPVGMIPLFLVPYAIFFHTLSLLNLIWHRK